MSDNRKEQEQEVTFNNGGQSEAELMVAERVETCFHPLNSTSDLDRSGGRIISLIIGACKKMEKDLIEAEEMSKKDGPWMISLPYAGLFRRGDGMLLIHQSVEKLKSKNPGKGTFSALIISQDYYHFRHHQIILSEYGNWDVKWAQSGESAFASYHPSMFCFDLIIIHHDLLGVDAPTVTRMYRDLSVPSPVIFGVSASTATKEIETFHRSGLDEFVKKGTHDAEAILEATREAEIYNYVEEQLNETKNVLDNIANIFY